MTTENHILSRTEETCESHFRNLGDCFHLCTNENHPILFHNEETFKAAMNIVALISLMNPGLKVLTFEIMSNHLHFALSGTQEMIQEWWPALVKKLKTDPQLVSSENAIETLKPKILHIENLENLRNVIAYINRNGFLVSPADTPFSYRWGANRFYFNPEAKLRYEDLGTNATYRIKRTLFHSNKAAFLDKIHILDNYVSPLCFCRIDLGESVFRDARHYSSKISKNIETNASIAKSIGESIFYTDEELFSLIVGKCIKNYGCPSPSKIPAEAKIELAKWLHYDYNAGNKQICRILRIDLNSLSALFP